MTGPDDLSGDDGAPLPPARRTPRQASEAGGAGAAGAADSSGEADRSGELGEFGGFGAGLRAIAPLLLGVAPFGVVAGATPVTHGMGWEVAVGFSTIVFAGASQLASIEVLTGGGSVLVAVLAAWTINLRMILYSASLAPHVTRLSRSRRMLMAYVLTDQVYATSIVRWGEATVKAPAVEEQHQRWRFYMGGGLALWVTWQVSTIVGILVGNAVPSGIHLEFAVPLAFLVLLIPTLVTRPAIVAAATGGAAAVLAAQMGAGPTSIMIGSVVGIVAGAIVDSDHPGNDDSGGNDSGDNDSGDDSGNGDTDEPA